MFDTKSNDITKRDLQSRNASFYRSIMLTEDYRRYCTGLLLVKWSPDVSSNDNCATVFSLLRCRTWSKLAAHREFNLTVGHPVGFVYGRDSLETRIKLVLPALHSSSWQSRLIIKCARWPFIPGDQETQSYIVVATISRDWISNVVLCVIHYIVLFVSNNTKYELYESHLYCT